MSVIVNTVNGPDVQVTTSDGADVDVVTGQHMVTLVETAGGYQVDVQTNSLEAKAVSEAGAQVMINTTTLEVQANINNSIPIPFPSPGPQGEKGEDGQDGLGDMNKAVYDADNDGIVDQAAYANLNGGYF